MLPTHGMQRATIMYVPKRVKYLHRNQFRKFEVSCMTK
uniref:Uncharacterized protein n=1 Tax=Rhizophora mucronata TaxID=61149 RepID=A0A2P2R1M2_RHIMU